MNNPETQIQRELGIQRAQIINMCEFIENFLYPKCWTDSNTLDKLNETHKIRKERYG